MAIDTFRDPLIIKWYTDSQGNKISVQRQNEQHKVVKNKITLAEIPDEYYRVQISGYTELNPYGSVPSSSTEFVVNYTLGEITFYSSEEAKTITINQYYSRGIIYYPSSRIYYTTDINGNVTSTLQDFITTINTYKYYDSYDNTKEYIKNNIVFYEGTTYICIVDSSTGNLPNTSNWRQFSAGMNWVGDYDNSKQYFERDIVNYGTELYICILKPTIGTYPTNTTYWDELLSIQELQDLVDNTKYIGIYNGSTQYYKNNIVTYNNCSYIVKQNTLGNQPPVFPTLENTYWGTIAVKGSDGANLTFKYAYDNSTQYSKDDLVYYSNGSINGVYAAKQNTIGNLPTNTTYWSLFMAGGGDMNTSVYDINNNGIVDNSEKLGNQLPSYYTTAGNINISDTNHFFGTNPTVESALTYLGSISVNVNNYGAIGDGLTDDTTAIQLAITDAKNTNRKVEMSSGKTYIVSSLNIYSNTIIEGNGAILKKKANAGNWSSMLTTANNMYSGDYDSSTQLVIKNLILNGNRENQGSYTNYELQHSPLIYLQGDSTKAGKTRVILENVHLMECVADGVSVSCNVNVKILNCRSWNCFRGGIDIFGGNSQVEIANFEGDGNIHPQGIHIEIDVEGYNNSKKTDILMTNIIDGGGFSVNISDNSNVIGSNIKSLSTSFTISAQNSTIKLSNSSFEVGAISNNVNRVNYPNNVIFDNCTFYANENDTTEQDRTISPINVYWNISGSTYQNQSLQLLNCNFKVRDNVESSDTIIAIQCQSDTKSYNNMLIVDGGIIDSTYDIGIKIVQGGNIIIKDVINKASVPVWFNGSSTNGVDITIDGGIIYTVTSCMYINTHDAGNTITHKNVLIDETQNVLTSNYGITNNVYKGKRTILLTTAPTDTTHGLRGDECILKTPVAGSAYKWVCVTSGAGSGAVWKASEILAS